MSSPELHIKDSYFFEVPKFLWRSHRDANWDGKSDFPDFWIALDDEYLTWEADRFLSEAQQQGLTLGNREQLLDEYSHWLHDHPGKPFYDYLVQVSPQGALTAAQLETLDDVQASARDIATYKRESKTWSAEKVAGYNKALDGKILIPQPFGTLRNLHERGAGFCISKFMIVEVIVAALVALLFIRLAQRMQRSDRPQGRLWNMLEAMLVFLRDEVARPAIGKHDADRYVPLLWTIFMFVLGLNLMGMVPWVGAPTSAFAVTLGLAAVTLLTGIIMGSIKFGPVGYWTNQVPHMDLPWYMAFLLKPFLWVIEVFGLLIKHAILGVRLLANMVAGHLVLLGVLTTAFSLEAVANANELWWLGAFISVIGSAVFSLLELFVAFLQAYIFTFLSALFIGAAVHHH